MKQILNDIWFSLGLQNSETLNLLIFKAMLLFHSFHKNWSSFLLGMISQIDCAIKILSEVLYLRMVFT